MTFFIALEEGAEQHLNKHVKAGNKILLKRIYRLFGELEKHPETGIGKPHKLKYENTEIWTRRIDDKHRMLYLIDKEKRTVFIISLWGHYGDK